MQTCVCATRTKVTKYLRVMVSCLPPCFTDFRHYKHSLVHYLCFYRNVHVHVHVLYIGTCTYPSWVERGLTVIMSRLVHRTLFSPLIPIEVACTVSLFIIIYMNILPNRKNNALALLAHCHITLYMYIADIRAIIGQFASPTSKIQGTVEQAWAKWADCTIKRSVNSYMLKGCVSRV